MTESGRNMNLMKVRDHRVISIPDERKSFCRIDLTDEADRRQLVKPPCIKNTHVDVVTLEHSQGFHPFPKKISKHNSSLLYDKINPVIGPGRKEVRQTRLTVLSYPAGQP